MDDLFDILIESGGTEAYVDSETPQHYLVFKHFNIMIDSLLDIYVLGQYCSNSNMQTSKIVNNN